MHSSKSNVLDDADAYSVDEFCARHRMSLRSRTSCSCRADAHENRCRTRVPISRGCDGMALCARDCGPGRGSRRPVAWRRS